jgi:hypothetical protein
MRPPLVVSAVSYLAHTLEQGINGPRLFAAGTLAVAASILFGVSAAPGRTAYAQFTTSSSLP